MRVLSNFIKGGMVAPAADEYLDDVNPATGEVTAKVPRSHGADVDFAVAAAGKAFETWSESRIAERAELLDAVAARIEKRAEELAELESRDTGKPITLAATLDIPRAVANFRFFAGAIRHDATAFHPMDGALNYTLRAPVGVAALVTPWNLPLYLLSWKTAPALAMGNTVVAKPSELTPLTAGALAEVFQEVKAPRGVFNLVHGTGPEAGEPLVAHPGVALVSFTGGTVTGAKVAAAAAPRFKKLSLELGGKNATVVFADADLEGAVEGAVKAGFTNQGQVCLSGSRLLVERAILPRFTERFVARVKALRLRPPCDPEGELGALISEAHRAKVEGYVALAKEEGGRVLTGGCRPQMPPPYDKGAFLEPTVIAGLSPRSRTATEEIFGPVVTIHAFEDEAEAVTLANGVEYGLAAAVFTRDLSRAHRVAARLETGMVWVNCWLVRDLRVPFGGAKESGVGREGGVYSLEFFSESRNVCIKL